MTLKYFWTRAQDSVCVMNMIDILFKVVNNPQHYTSLTWLQWPYIISVKMSFYDIMY